MFPQHQDKVKIKLKDTDIIIQQINILYVVKKGRKEKINMKAKNHRVKYKRK